MHIEDFRKEAHKVVDEFCDGYKESHDRGDEDLCGLTYAEAFPLNQEEGEWWDQFLDANF